MARIQLLRALEYKDVGFFFGEYAYNRLFILPHTHIHIEENINKLEANKIPSGRKFDTKMILYCILYINY